MRPVPAPTTHPLAFPGRVDTVSAPIEALAAAANAIPRGLLVFDCDARVLAHNAAAARMLGRSAPLALVPMPGAKNGLMRLAGTDASLQAAVEQAVHDCATPSAPPIFGIESPQAARSLRIDSGASGRGMVLHLVPTRRPTPRRETEVEADASAVIGTLIEVGPREQLDVSLLVQLFDLSTSSARVAEAYLRVDSVKEAARQLGISANTVKTHLATVYERTGCSRQSQLVRLVMTLRDGARG